MPRRKSSLPAEGAMRRLLVALVQSKGSSTTIGALLDDRLLGEFVRELTLGDLSGGAATPRVGRAPRATTPPPAGKPGRKRKADTRTAEGRNDYDAATLAFITSAKEPVSAEQARKKVGGTAIQFRASVERLLKAKKIKREGKARGTKYRGS